MAGTGFYSCKQLVTGVYLASEVEKSRADDNETRESDGFETVTKICVRYLTTVNI